jgi:hypothetical protein
MARIWLVDEVMKQRIVHVLAGLVGGWWLVVGGWPAPPALAHRALLRQSVVICSRSRCAWIVRVLLLAKSTAGPAQALARAGGSADGVGSSRKREA